MPRPGRLLQTPIQQGQGVPFEPLADWYVTGLFANFGRQLHQSLDKWPIGARWRHLLLCVRGNISVTQTPATSIGAETCTSFQSRGARLCKQARDAGMSSRQKKFRTEFHASEIHDMFRRYYCTCLDALAQRVRRDMRWNRVSVCESAHMTSAIVSSLLRRGMFNWRGDFSVAISVYSSNYSLPAIIYTS
jgi:hypothetical protein